MCGHRHHHSSSYLRREARDPGLRASDADREQTAETLRDHAGEGRLDPEELERRLERAYAAVTVGDLDALVVDLPRPAATGRQRSRGPALAMQPLALILAVLVAVSLLVGHLALWVAIPLFFLLRRPRFAPFGRL